MIDAYRELLEDLSQTPNDIQDLIGGAPAPPTNTAGEREAVELLNHLTDVERMMRARIQNMVARDTPYLRRFDAAAAARARDVSPAELRAAFEAFATERAESVSIIMNLALKDWERTGIHDDFGEVSIEDLVERMIEHDAHHIEQLKRLVASES